MNRKEAILRIKDHMEHHGIGKYPLMTNADRIRAMNDEELGIFLYRYFWGREANMPIARHRMVDWLQQPAEEDT